MKTDVLNVLRSARKRISDPANWTQECWARTAGDESVYYSDSTAAKWCADGALRASGCDYNAVCDASQLLDIATKNIIRYNDTHTHEEVLAVFDQVIAGLEEEIRQEAA